MKTFQKPLTQGEEAECFRLLREGTAEQAKQAKNILIERNMRLVAHVAKKYQNADEDMDDLISIGCIGLIKAVDKFDCSYEVCFSTYAVPMIIGEIKRFIRDDGIVKISRSIKENNWKIKQAAGRFADANNREPTVEELVCATGLSKEDIVIAASAVKEPEYIDRDDYTGLELRLEDDKEEVINQILLEKLLGELKENERKLIEMRYYQEKTQTEVAKMLGMSQVQVSRNEKKILAKLRNLYCS